MGREVNSPILGTSFCYFFATIANGGSRRLRDISNWKWRQEVRVMLVITRREGEEVVIGDPANPLGVVRIASIKGDRVRIAFDFPREVPVHRHEVAEEINKNGPAIAGKIRPASND
jgi:carbon storage regulator